MSRDCLSKSKKPTRVIYLLRILRIEFEGMSRNCVSSRRMSIRAEPSLQGISGPPWFIFSFEGCALLASEWKPIVNWRRCNKNTQTYIFCGAPADVTGSVSSIDTFTCCCCRTAGLRYRTGGMVYAVSIGSAAAGTGMAAQGVRRSACGGPRSHVAGDWAKMTRSRGSATLQRLLDLRRHSCRFVAALIRVYLCESVAPLLPWPTPHQSNLFAPNQAFIFSSPFAPRPWRTRSSVRFDPSFIGGCCISPYPCLSVCIRGCFSVPNDHADHPNFLALRGGWLILPKGARDHV